MIPEIFDLVSIMGGVQADETRLGRPRDPSRDAAILAAALDLLGEVGYERVTVRAIAERAGAGLATIYRRWPTKDALIVDAVAGLADPFERIRPGDDPAENLQRMLSALLDMLQGRRRGVVANIIGQLADRPALAEALRGEITGPRLAAAADQLGELTGLGPDGARQAAEQLAASIFFQSLVLGRHLGEPDLRDLIDRTVAWARAATPPRG
jgi:AcrR family transcriptional regulator